MEDTNDIQNEEQTGRLQQTAVSRCAFMVLRGKEAGNVFWTSGGDYRTDWYDLLGEFDTAEEAQAHWRFHYYNPQPRHIG